MSVVRPTEYIVVCDGRALCESRVFSTDVTETSARQTLQVYGWGYVVERNGRALDLCSKHYSRWRELNNDRLAVVR